MHYGGCCPSRKIVRSPYTLSCKSLAAASINTGQPEFSQVWLDVSSD